MYFCLAITSDFLSLLADPLFKTAFAVLEVKVTLSKTDNDISLSSFDKFIPLMPFEDLPLKILSFFD